MAPFSPAESVREEPPPWFYDASLLFRRMALIQIDQAELAEADPLLFCELQGICTLCRSKNRCIAELDKLDADDPNRWHAYCPNADALTALGTEQNCGQARSHGAGDKRVVVTRLGSAILRMPGRPNKKIYLEGEPGDSPFRPRQYYYAASKSGVVPTGSNS